MVRYEAIYIYIYFIFLNKKNILQMKTKPTGKVIML